MNILSCSSASDRRSERALIGYLIAGGAATIAYVWFELWSGHSIALSIGFLTFVAPQAAGLLFLVHALLRRALPRGDIDALFYGALYVGAAAVKLHERETEGFAMFVDMGVGIALLIVLSCLPVKKSLR